MICLSIKENDFEKCKAVLKTVPFAEIRNDLCHFSISETVELVRINPNVIIPCRGLSKESGSTHTDIAEEYIKAALNAGARYIDIELDSPDSFIRDIANTVHDAGSELITSYHDYESTPPDSVLHEIFSECKSTGCDIIKIVTYASDVEDVSRIMSLYRYRNNADPKLVAFTMGEKTAYSRLLCIKSGAPFTYASIDEKESSRTASGQYSYSRLSSLLKAGKYILPDSVTADSVTIPSSKSESQRMIVLAMLYGGKTILRQYEACRDSENAIRVIKELGCTVHEFPFSLEIDSPGINTIKKNLRSIDSINTGESGLLTRLLLPAIAILSDKPIIITGESSLMKRDLSQSETALISAGFDMESNDGRLPFIITGRKFENAITERKVSFAADASSQTVSGFLVAVPLTENIVRLVIADPVSIPYIDLTLKTLEKFGIYYDMKMDSGSHILDISLKNIQNAGLPHDREIYLNSDWSSAAYIAVTFVTAGLKQLKTTHEASQYKLCDMSINTSQADEAILKVLGLCGIGIVYENEQGNGKCDVLISVAGSIHKFNFDARNCPDLFPILAVLACFCDGECRISGVHRLKNKESDRAAAIYTELTSLGAVINFEDDDMIISGHDILKGYEALHGGDCHSHNDHRIVMALAAAAAGIDGRVTIDRIDPVDKSFPSFFEKLKKH